MPIISSLASISARAYGWCAGKLKILITDNFNRANGPLGNTDTGQTWQATRGTWSIVSNQANSSDAGSTYPLASVNIQSQDVVVSASINGGGPGVSFWLTDANSWWASSVNYRTTSYSFSCCGGSLGGSNVGCGSVTTTSYYQRAGCGCYPNAIESGGQCVDSSTLLPLGPLCCSGSTGPGDTGCGSTTSTSYYQLTTCSGTNYITELKLYKDLVGTITTVTTQVLDSNTSSFSNVGSIKASTLGEQITVKGYTNSNLTSQLGPDLTNTATGATRGVNVGIIKTPSDTNAGSTLDNFSAENV